MDRLWTPWRYSYITGEEKDPAPGVPQALAAWLESGEHSGNPTCVFCNMVAAVDYSIRHGMRQLDAWRETLMVYRGENVFLCLNRFPYSSGHLLIVPYDHRDRLTGLSRQTAGEMMTLAQRTDRILHDVYRPHGLNFGLNLGDAAGAGIASHLHMHAVPRWSGDTNFMTVTANTRIIPEGLEATWEKMRQAFADAEPADGAS